jgi:hypothetical protein
LSLPKNSNSSIQESRRILEHDGLLVIAVIKLSKSCSGLAAAQEFMKLGILSFTWASEHYEYKNIKSMMNKVGFDIIDIHWIGFSCIRAIDKLLYLQ